MSSAIARLVALSKERAPVANVLFGEVVGTKMQKTVKVRVANTKMHPIIQKPVTIHRNVFAHDETEQCVVGDYVRIDHCQQKSKNKHYTLGEIVLAAKRAQDSTGKLHTQRVHRGDLTRTSPLFQQFSDDAHSQSS
ncbi:uncharacterized protein BJ171DRAFT_446605 [Polychytrium aggregatum]|uniref:uncharacterized protein n=1 Tax=Polychytrium aggregatum TaxID=110093 RepID=UPI0022FDBE38|nr:uncharacterized protein BJ171DRAFT_446605 [Polychytrium aggregatum]KAI9197161.1 hypothetical protein BJ171DRAFT_446605 [Polychytrium aggregatum]